MNITTNGKVVLRSVAIPETQIKIPQKGKRSLKVMMIDPGVIMDKIEIVKGERKDSYFGADVKQ